MNESMIECIKSRRSIRGFLPEPASRETLNSIFETAQQAPSNCNTQPWKVRILSGDACNSLRGKALDAVQKGQMSMDYPYDQKAYTGDYKNRQYEAARVLYAAMGIERSDKAGRAQAFMDNFKFFNAPHVAFFFLPEQFGLREAADLGMYFQNVMLSLKAHGLASCPQTALGFIADLVREELEVEDSLKLLFGLSFGYEDTDNPVNKAITKRASLEETIVFYD